MCDTGWGDCTDHNSYEVRCTDGTCECVVNNQVQSTFPATMCPDLATANDHCGWSLS